MGCGASKTDHQSETAASTPAKVANTIAHPVADTGRSAKRTAVSAAAATTSGQHDKMTYTKNLHLVATESRADPMDHHEDGKTESAVLVQLRLLTENLSCRVEELWADKDTSRISSAADESNVSESITQDTSIGCVDLNDVEMLFNTNVVSDECCAGGIKNEADSIPKGGNDDCLVEWLCQLPDALQQHIDPQLEAGSIHFTLNHVRLLLTKALVMIEHLEADMQNGGQDSPNKPQWWSSWKGLPGQLAESSASNASLCSSFANELLALFLYTADTATCSCQNFESCHALCKKELAARRQTSAGNLPKTDAHKREKISPSNVEACGHNVALWAVMNWTLRVSRDFTKSDATCQAAAAVKELYVPLAQNLQAALEKQPTAPIASFRGIKGQTSTIYLPGQTVVWDAFSSASLLGVEARGFMGKEQGTFFTIEGVSAPMIDFISWFPSQAEALFRCGTHFKVRSRMSNTLLSMLDSNAELIKMAEVDATGVDGGSDEPFRVKKLSTTEKISAIVTHASNTQFLYKEFLSKYVDGVVNTAPNSRSEGAFAITTLIGNMLSIHPEEKYRAALIASGGAGKSSAMLSILAHVSLETDYAIAVFVPLPSTNFHQNSGIDRYVLHTLGIAENAPGDDQPHNTDEDDAASVFMELCQRRLVVILLDSLDEVDGINASSSSPTRYILDRNPLVRDYAHAVVISTRDELLQEQNIDPRTLLSTSQSTTPLYVQAFNKEDKRAYVKKRRSLCPAGSSTEATDRLLQAVENETTGVEEELSNPFRLSMFVDTAIEHPASFHTQRLSRNRVVQLSLWDIYAAYLHSRVITRLLLTSKIEDGGEMMTCKINKVLLAAEILAVGLLKERRYHSTMSSAVEMLRGQLPNTDDNTIEQPQEKEQLLQIMYCLPLRVENIRDPHSSFSFRHKSLQEWLVAKNFTSTFKTCSTDSAPTCLVPFSFGQSNPFIVKLVGSWFALDVDTIGHNAEKAVALVNLCSSTVEERVDGGNASDALSHNLSNVLSMLARSQYPLQLLFKTKDDVDNNGITEKKASLAQLHIANARLDYGNFTRLNLQGTVFHECSMIGADLSNTWLDGTAFNGCGCGKEPALALPKYGQQFKSAVTFTLPVKGPRGADKTTSNSIKVCDGEELYVALQEHSSNSSPAPFATIHRFTVSGTGDVLLRYAGDLTLTNGFVPEDVQRSSLVPLSHGITAGADKNYVGVGKTVSDTSVFQLCQIVEVDGEKQQLRETRDALPRVRSFELRLVEKEFLLGARCSGDDSAAIARVKPHHHENWAEKKTKRFSFHKANGSKRSSQPTFLSKEERIADPPSRYAPYRITFSPPPAHTTGVVSPPTLGKVVGFAFSDFKNSLEVLDTQTGATVATMPSMHFPASGCFSQDGTILYCVSSSSSIHTFQCTDGGDALREVGRVVDKDAHTCTGSINFLFAASATLLIIGTSQEIVFFDLDNNRVAKKVSGRFKENHAFSVLPSANADVRAVVLACGLASYISIPIPSDEYRGSQQDGTASGEALPGHINSVHSTVVSRCGRYAATSTKHSPSGVPGTHVYSLETYSLLRRCYTNVKNDERGMVLFAPPPSPDASSPPTPLGLMEPVFEGSIHKHALVLHLFDDHRSLGKRVVVHSWDRSDVKSVLSLSDSPCGKYLMVMLERNVAVPGETRDTTHHWVNRQQRMYGVVLSTSKIPQMIVDGSSQENNHLDVAEGMFADLAPTCPAERKLTKATWCVIHHGEDIETIGTTIYTQKVAPNKADTVDTEQPHKGSKEEAFSKSSSTQQLHHVEVRNWQHGGSLPTLGRFVDPLDCSCRVGSNGYVSQLYHLHPRPTTEPSNGAQHLLNCSSGGHLFKLHRVCFVKDQDKRGYDQQNNAQQLKCFEVAPQFTANGASGTIRGSANNINDGDGAEEPLGFGSVRNILLQSMAK